jgi:hypothetical protein
VCKNIKIVGNQQINTSDYQLKISKALLPYLTTPLVDWPMAIFFCQSTGCEKCGRRVMVIAESFSMGKDNLDGV